MEAGTKLVCECQVPFLEDALTLQHTPEPVINIIHYKLSGLHHDTEPKLPEQPVLYCDFNVARAPDHVPLFHREMILLMYYGHTRSDMEV